MKRNDKIKNDYFEWLIDLVCDKKYLKKVSYRKLLIFLHNTEFRYSIPMDVNRAVDGMDLRDRFADECHVDNIDDILDGPCSVLEMMIALSLRCEEHIMDDPDIGNRTGQWFWDMIVSLGLGTMTDDRFDKKFVEEKVSRFLDREYEANGKGGLFTIEHCKYDLRTVEIWYQLNYYLSSII